MEQKEIEAIGNKLIAALGGVAEKEEEKAKAPQQKAEAKEAKEKGGINLDEISRILGVK
jgi:hypothetical protein